MTYPHVVEGIAGVWSYHRAADELGHRSLCGRLTMPTKIPLSIWGHVGHLPERWCDECKKLAEEKE